MDMENIKRLSQLSYSICAINDTINDIKNSDTRSELNLEFIISKYKLWEDIECLLGVRLSQMKKDLELEVIKNANNLQNKEQT